jgi:hypothetical protein
LPSYLSSLNLNKNELQNARIQNLGSAPATPVTGQLYYDTGTNKLLWWNGTSWIDATGGGTPADASASTKGVTKLSTAPASGSNPIAVGDNDARVTDGQAAGTASIRQLGTGSTAAFPGNGRLDQLAAPTSAVSLNSQKITSLATPTATGDAATKGYVDSAVAGLTWKTAVRVATTGNGTLASAFANGQTVDGVTLATGDRILLKNQTSAAENGIYTVNASGAPTRAADADAWAEIVNAAVFVAVGTANADTGWVSTADAGGTIGTTAMPWTQFTGASSFVDGAALLRTGNTVDVQVDGSTIEVSSDALRVKDGGITNAKVASIDASTKLTGATPVANGGTGQTTAKAGRETGLGAAGYYSSATHSSGTTITISQSTHGLRASRGLIVQCQLESDGSVVYADVTVSSGGDVTVTFAASQSANTIRVTIVG